jgi:hypothetical protein
MFRVSVSLKLNQASIKKKIDMAMAKSPAIKKLAYNKAYGIFYNAKRMMLKEFDRHPVTQEIEAGPRAVNISNTLDGYGNLFSFIGFEAGENPTDKLRNLLEVATQFRQTIYRQGVWYFKISLPDKGAIENVTQMPWEKGNSWAYGVETFISGLSNYMYKKWSGSRSGMGFQLPYENWEDIAFTSRPYISEILNNFRERVNNR